VIDAWRTLIAGAQHAFVRLLLQLLQADVHRRLGDDGRWPSNRNR